MSLPRAGIALLVVAALAAPTAGFVPVDAPEERLPHDAELITSWYGPLSEPRSDEPEVIALDFLARHQAALGIPDLDALEKTSTRSSLTATHHRWEQSWGGLPVEGSEVSVHVLHDGTVWVVHSRTVQDVVAQAPVVDAQEALQMAIERVPGTVIGQREMVLAVGDEGIPAFDVWIRPLDNPYTKWNVRIDRTTGEMLEAYDMAYYASASGNVWVDPIVHSGDADVRGDTVGTNNLQDLSAAYFPVSVQNLTEVGGQPLLEGPFVVIREAVRAGGDYDVDHLDPRFEEFMSYYWIDHAQQRIQALGFEGETGVADYQIDAFPHAQMGIHNAFYMAGLPPYQSGNGMVAFGYRAPCADVVVTGIGCPAGEAGPGVHPFHDVAEGADVILHEYGHAVLDHQVPGIRQSADGLGEGWSDFWAKTLIAPLPDTHFDDCLGTWFGAHVWPQKDGEVHCIRDLTNDFGDEIMDERIHTAGQLFSGAMWSVRDNMTGDEDAGLDANETMHRLVLEGNFLLPQSGTIPKAFEAYLQADVALQDGQNVPLMVNEFERRNMTQHMELSETVQDVLAANEVPVQEAQSEKNTPFLSPLLVVVTGLALVVVRRRG